MGAEARQELRAGAGTGATPAGPRSGEQAGGRREGKELLPSTPGKKSVSSPALFTLY